MSLTPRERVQLVVWRRGIELGSVARTAARGLEMRGLGVTTHAYGPHRLEQLDRIAAPSAAGDAPILVYVHGGGWVCGVRSLYRCDLAPFARAGHVVFNLDYPLAPEAPFPRALESVIRALAWIREREPGAERVALAGDSAGGNLVAMAAAVLTNPALFELVDPALADLTLPEIDKVVSIYGVMDRFTWLEHRFPAARLFMTCYGGAAAYEREVRPDNCLTPLDLTFQHLPPIFVVAAGRDPLCESSQIFHQALASRGFPVRYQLYPDEAHGFLNMPWRKASHRLKRDMLAFLASAPA